MEKIAARQIDFKVLAATDSPQPYPYVRSEKGEEVIYSVSPLHRRSFVVRRHDDGRYVVSKGNGLCFTKLTFPYSPESPTKMWGLLQKEDALREYHIGQDVHKLDIRTYQMECVLELNYPILIEPTNTIIKPCLLQYDVECPYRISDAPFMDRKQIKVETARWERWNQHNYKKYHLIASDILIGNLRTLLDHKVQHSTICGQNYTWALEHIDFEPYSTPRHPHTETSHSRQVCDSYGHKVAQTYATICYIANVLRERIDYRQIDQMFAGYGFELKEHCVAKKT